jgi:hypothetical protein
MRVALFFVAFSFLFAFVIPQLVSTLYKDDDQIAWQLMQGADPTVILEETASGTPRDECGAEGYLYYQSSEGYRYIRRENSPYIVALIEDKPQVFKITDKASEARLAESAPHIQGNLTALETILLDCVKGAVPPQPSQLVIRAQS